MKKSIKSLILILLFLILGLGSISFYNYRTETLERRMVEMFYKDYYISKLESNDEEYLKEHFDKMSNVVIIDSRVLSSLNPEMAKIVKRTRNTNSDLVIKPKIPYSDLSYDYEFIKK